MSPEFQRNREISAQSDIYSLGILILEIITRKNNIPTEQIAGRTYIEQVRRTITFGIN
jgi:disease resistance protein RPM1